MPTLIPVVVLSCLKVAGDNLSWKSQVLYTATTTGTYDISIIYGGSGINQSPFRLTVQPARRHFSNSPATGMALTLSTAGTRSSVTITVRDRHGNWQPDPSVAQVRLSSNPRGTEHPCVAQSLEAEQISHFRTLAYVLAHLFFTIASADRLIPSIPHTIQVNGLYAQS